MKKLSTADFVANAIKRHGTTYSYAKTVYAGATSPVIITCPDHGDFQQAPTNHTRGANCPQCAKIEANKKKTGVQRGPLSEEHKARIREARKKSPPKKSQKAKVVQLFNEGKSIPQIASELGLHKVTVRHHLRADGISFADENKEADRHQRATEFIRKMEEKHEHRFSYVEESFTSQNDPMRITCPKHGEFQQSPRMHLKGLGCPRCSKILASKAISWDHDDFLAAARKVHGDTFTYLSTYKGIREPMTVECPIHGKFETLPTNHIFNSKHGCPACARAVLRLSVEQWKDECGQKHNNSYDYGKVEVLTSLLDVVTIGCPAHGEFRQQAGIHRSGSRCPICAGRRLDTATFISRATQIHGDAYDYSRANCPNTSEKVELGCRSCGAWFHQVVSYHLYSSSGCPACSLKVTRGHKEIAEYLQSLGLQVELNNRKVLHPLEIDIWLPELNLGVEFHGVFWHRDKIVGKTYHAEKHQQAQDNGIALIQIFEDEWENNPEKIKALLAHKTGKSSGRLYARKCSVDRVTPKEGGAFLKSLHIQGKGRAEAYYGLTFEGQLKAVASFTHPLISGGGHDTEWHVARFASSGSVVGGFSKLFSAFVREFNPASVGTYADLRWGQGQVYVKSGFSLSHVTPPNYAYVRAEKGRLTRYHRFSFRKDRLKEILGPDFDPAKTEKQMTDEMGLWRVYDAGNAYYVWRPRD